MGGDGDENDITKTLEVNTSYGMGALGLSIFVFCMLVLVKDLYLIWIKQRRFRTSGDTISFVIKLLLPWPPLARALDCLLNATVLLTSPVSSQSWLAIFLGTIPGFMYLNLYLLLVFFWAWLYLSSKSLHTFKKNVIHLWTIVAALVTLIWVVFMMSMAADPNERPHIHQIYSATISILSILVGVCFVVWSIALVHRLRQRAQPSPRTVSIATKVFFLTLGCSALFFMRGITTSLNTFAFSDDPLKLYISRWVLFVGCDFGSAVFLLVIIFSRTPKRNTQSIPSDAYREYMQPTPSYQDGLAFEGHDYSSSYPNYNAPWSTTLNSTSEDRSRPNLSFSDPFCSTSSDEE